MFSFTPEPAVSKPAYDPQARQARAEQPRSDGFGALVDSNAAASDTERQARPAADAPRHRDDTSSRPKADNGRAGADTGPRQPPASAAGDTNAASNTTDQTAAPTTPPVIAPVAKVVDAVLTPDDAIVSGDATEGTETNGDASAATTNAAAVAVVLAVAPAVVDPAAPATGDAAGLAVATTTKTATPTGITTAPTGADAAFAEAAANAIPETPVEAGASVPKAETISVAVAATATPVKAAPTVKPAAVASTDDNQPADAVSDQSVKPDADPSVVEGKPASHDKTASDTGTVETDAPDHAVKHTQPTEHRAAPAQLDTAQPDPGLQPPSGAPQQQPQTHAANLTATPVPQVSTPLASMPVPLSGLAVDIALRAAGGSSRFEIRLDPAELGRIDVRLDVDKHGNVTSHLTVERPATFDMLRRDAPQLQQALEDAGLKTGDFGLQFSLRDQSSSGRDNDNGSGRNSQRLVIAEDDIVPAQVAGRTYGRMLGSSSGVDIRI